MTVVMRAGSSASTENFMIVEHLGGLQFKGKETEAWQHAQVVSFAQVKTFYTSGSGEGQARGPVSDVGPHRCGSRCS